MFALCRQTTEAPMQTVMIHSVGSWKRVMTIKSGSVIAAAIEPTET